jgi:hypothetical protein
MKQITVSVPENKYSAFMKLINSLDYVSVPKLAENSTRNIAEKFRAKIPKEVGMEMHKQLEELRNEWERNIL